MAASVVAIVMGSDSDLPVMREAAVILAELDVPHAIDIVSAHRTPDKLYAFAKSAKANGVQVMIAGAGGAAHLPGMIASLTTLPVIGVPVRTGSLDGMDSLLSIVQMPPGVPVATVAINGAKNAGLLAAQILALADPALADRLEAYKRGLEQMVHDKAARLAMTGDAQSSPSTQ